MEKYEELKIDGASTHDLMQSSRNAQRIDINGHYYIIGEVTTDYSDPSECCLVKMKRLPERGTTVYGDRDRYGQYVKHTPVNDEALIDLVKSFRDSIGEGKITFFDRKKYTQAVTNLAEGLPASVVAEALDQAAEYVRNQRIAGNWNDDSD